MPHKMHVMANLVISETGDEQMWGVEVKGSSGNSIKPSDTEKQTAEWALCTVKPWERRGSGNCAFL